MVIPLLLLALGASYWNDWLNEDVRSVITPGEMVVARRPMTESERRVFIEWFWASHEVTKREHYRRIGYANEKFSGTKRGFLTDRGMVYIKFGAPDEVVLDANGERWRYGDVTVSFAKAGDHRLVNAGAVEVLEKIRATPRNGMGPQTQPLPEKMNEFTRDMLRMPPPARFPELEGAVDSHLHLSTLPLRVETSFAPLTDATTWVNLKLVFDSERPDIRLYVRATNLDDGTFEACEDTFWDSSSVQALALAAGRYHIDLAAKNVINGTLATWESDVVVPNYDKSFFKTMR